MYQLSNPATTLKHIQGYSFILRMLQDRAVRQNMFELLMVISWSSPYASSQHLDCQSFGLVSVVRKTKLRDIPIHDICSDLGPFRYLSLPLYAIKWCETKSHFLGCSKTIAWASWQNKQGLTETLLALTNEPSCSSLSTSRRWNDVWLS